MSSSSEIITKVNENDIICGRRGVALKHPGNLAYRKIVGLNKELYATCLKNEKLRVSKSIVAAMREVGGRFLERTDGTISSSIVETDEEGRPVVYKDIGDKRAIEKTSQALREGQPKLIKKLAQKRAVHSAVAAAVASSAPHAHQPLPSYMSHRALPSYMNPAAASLSSISPTASVLAAAPSRGVYSPLAPSVHIPYAVQQRGSPQAQAVTPPPPGLLPHLLSQFESDLLFLALLRRARQGR